MFGLSNKKYKDRILELETIIRTQDRIIKRLETIINLQNTKPALYQPQMQYTLPEPVKRLNQP